MQSVVSHSFSFDLGVHNLYQWPNIIINKIEKPFFFSRWILIFVGLASMWILKRCTKNRHLNNRLISILIVSMGAFNWFRLKFGFLFKQVYALLSNKLITFVTHDQIVNLHKIYFALDSSLNLNYFNKNYVLNCLFGVLLAIHFWYNI